MALQLGNDIPCGTVGGNHAGPGKQRRGLAVFFDDGSDSQVSRQHGNWLHSELTELDLDLAGLPDFVEHLSVDFRDGGLVSVCNAFPARGL